MTDENKAKIQNALEYLQESYWKHEHKICQRGKTALALLALETYEVPMSAFADILAPPMIIRQVLAVIGYTIKETP